MQYIDQWPIRNNGYETGVELMTSNKQGLYYNKNSLYWSAMAILYKGVG